MPALPARSAFAKRKVTSGSSLVDMDKQVFTSFNILRMQLYIYIQYIYMYIHTCKEYAKMMNSPPHEQILMYHHRKWCATLGALAQASISVYLFHIIVIVIIVVSWYIIFIDMGMSENGVYPQL
jgi:hypothetical protein